MKYTGRIISLLIVVISSLGLILYNYISHVYWDIIYVAVSCIYLFVGWWLGKQYDKVRYLSDKDPLTESYNRRFVMDIFPKLKSLSVRKKQKLVIFLIDVDDFKSINDQFDHTVGDHVLLLIASTLKKTFRNSDYIVRWGGDEFLCIFPCTEESGINELHERFRKEFKILSNTLSANVSVSIGYATYPDDGSELNELIKIADMNMYSDKDRKNKGIHKA